MVSTISSAGCEVRSIAPRISPMRLVAPGRGLVVHDHDRLDRVGLVGGKLGLELGRIGAAAPVAGNEIDLDAPAPGHVVPQRREMAGLDHQHLVAGRERVDDRRLPRARPDDGKITTGPEVWNIFWLPSSTLRPSSPNSALRWSMTGMSMARRTRSGTGLGPGICRKCRPWCAVMAGIPRWRR